jgi:CO/xanthine dehydrogenase FAD-binding subunit
MRENELIVPPTLAEALALLAADARPFAGGTDLMVQRAPGPFVGLWKLPELRGISEHAESVSLGAMLTYAELRRSPLLAREFPLLVAAAAEVGGPAIQNCGTIGGNLANASPAGDLCPVLLVYDAVLELESTRGPRLLPYLHFHTAYRRTALQPGELITRILLPRRENGWIESYRKVGPRRAQAISKVSFAAAARLSDDRIADLRLALGSVAPTPLRCLQIEATLRGASLAALPHLPEEWSPIDDLRSTARYRSTVARRLIARFLESLSASR